MILHKETADTWSYACMTADVPSNGGACVLLAGQQIAVFNFTRKGTWYATQNECPHKKQMALSRGMIGSAGDEDEPKVACPFHKKTFSLLSGKCLNAEEESLKVFEVRVIGDKVYIAL